MKKFSNIVAILLVLVISSSMIVFAEPETKYADVLHEMGLFKGTDNGYELEKTLTREESATTLVRLLGEEANAKTEEYTGVFSDVTEDRWSFPYVMYCFENNITKGTGEDTFSPAQPISAEQFVTLVLRLLGYSDAEPNTALELAVTKKMLSAEDKETLETAEVFTRENMVYIVYQSLKTYKSDGTLLARYLADKEVITKEQAKEFGAVFFSNVGSDIWDMLGV